MSVIHIDEVRFICRLVPEGYYVLNAYTPVSFETLH